MQDVFYVAQTYFCLPEHKVILGGTAFVLSCPEQTLIYHICVCLMLITAKYSVDLHNLKKHEKDFSQIYMGVKSV